MFNKLSITIFWAYLMPIGIYFASLILFFQNTLYLALTFIIVLAISASIVFCLRAEFLAYTILIVYIGAIAVLFLFVIMMLNLKINLNPKISVGLSTWESAIVFFLLIKIILISKIMVIPNLLFSIGNGIIWPNFWDNYNFEIGSLSDVIVDQSWSSTVKIEILGELIYNNFSYLFILIGIVLLVAMVGALILTTSKNLIIKCDFY